MLFRLAPTRGWEYNQDRPGSHSAGLLDGVEHLPACSNSSQAKLNRIKSTLRGSAASFPGLRKEDRFAKRDG